MATPALDHVLRHNAWANKTLLEFCAALEPVALELSAAGTYGTLYGTLQHIVGGEQFYIRLLTGEVLGTSVRKTERRTLDDLIAIASLTGTRAIDLVANDHGARYVRNDSQDACAHRGFRGGVPRAPLGVASPRAAPTRAGPRDAGWDRNAHHTRFERR